MFLHQSKQCNWHTKSIRTYITLHGCMFKMGVFPNIWHWHLFSEDQPSCVDKGITFCGGHFHPKGFLSVNWLVQSRLILSTRNPFYLHCWRWSQKSFVTLSKFLVCHRTLPTDFLAQIQIQTRVPSSVFPCDVVIDALHCTSFKEQ